VELVLAAVNVARVARVGTGKCDPDGEGRCHRARPHKAFAGGEPTLAVVVLAAIRAGTMRRPPFTVVPPRVGFVP